MVDSFESREAMLGAGHVAPLEAWRSRITSGRPVPHFDPLDGGSAASLLILLETPAASRHDDELSVRFVSRDNPSGTQRNLSRFLDDAGIARRHMLLWNAVPWVLHAPGTRNRPLRRAEIREGLATLPGLLTLLPRLTTIALAGRIAREAAPTIAKARPEIAIIAMPHPSPANVCTSPSVASSIQAALATAARLMREEQR